MQARNGTWFVACAVAHGLATGTAIAAVAMGHWVLAVSSFVASAPLAAGMIKTMGALRCGRLL